MAAFLGSELKQKLLYHFFANPMQTYHVRELAGILKLDPGNLSRELNKLEKMGLFKASKKGKFKVYTINQQHEFFKLINSIMEKDNSIYRGVPAIIHGQNIESKDIKFICSIWDIYKFVSFCNTTIWGILGRNLLSIPSFTERVNIADNGIDAECMGDVQSNIINANNPFICEGWNVFQFKQRDMTPTNTTRKQIISKLVKDLKGALNSIYKKTQKKAANYILFTNIDLTHTEKADFKKSILYGYKDRVNAKVEIIGAGELAAFVNDVPHIRSSFFIPESFSTWEEYMRKDKEARCYGPWINLIGREESLKNLKDLINNKNIKAIVLYGPQGIGKSRLLLEATKDYSYKVVVVNNPEFLKPSEIGKFESPHQEIIILIDDADANDIENLTKEAFSRTNIKLAITLPTPENISFPSFGYDQRITPFLVDKLSDTESEQLLKETNMPMDFSLMSWIKYHAQGNPSILLAAANVATSLKEKPGDFIEKVGRQFENRVKKSFGGQGLLVLKLLSILTHVGISGDHKEEINVIHDLFGEGISKDEARKEIKILEQSGLINRKGSFVEVSLPIFAIYLSQQLLSSFDNLIPILLVKLSDSARTRFLRRLSRLNPEVVKDFWDEVFERDGLFRDRNTVINNIRILHYIAGAVPHRAIDVLESTILPLDNANRLQIHGEVRREFMWTLEQLLFRRDTSLRALRIVGLLGDAETENCSNNATGVFCECFLAMHYQMPITLNERLDLLKEFSGQKQAQALRLLSIKAMSKALTGTGFQMLRRSDSLEPFEGMPAMTYGEIWDYMGGICSLLFNLAEDKDKNITEAVCDILPDVVARTTTQGRPEEGIKDFKKLLNWVTQLKKINISKFARALNSVRRTFEDRVSKEDISEKDRNKLKGWLKELNQIKEELDSENFELRLKRWAGAWTHDDDDSVLSHKGGDYRFQVELKILAKEAVEDPVKLNDDIMIWLLSSNAQKAHAFFVCLGEIDSDRIWLPKFEKLAKEEQGSNAFALYCYGLKKHSHEIIKSRLEELFDNTKIHPLATLYTISYFEACAEGVKRISDLIEKGLLDPVVAGTALRYGRWIDTLKDDELLVLLKAIAGKNFKYDAPAVNLLSMWIHLKKPIKGKLADFGWQCLEAANPFSSRNDNYAYDQLASVLVKDDKERAFALAKKLIMSEEKDCWNPIDRYRSRRFWDELTRIDRKRALKMLLEICLLNPEHRFTVTWNLKEVLNQVRDRDLIIEFSLADEKWAEILSECISSKKPDFWKISIPMLEHYLSNERISTNIQHGLEQMGEVIMGGFHNHYIKVLGMINEILETPTIPAKVRLWLQKIEERYRIAISRQKMHDENEDVTDYFGYKRYLDGTGNKHLREWAISKALQGHQWRDILNKVNKEEVISILDKYQFLEDRKRIILRELEGF